MRLLLMCCCLLSPLALFAQAGTIFEVIQRGDVRQVEQMLTAKPELLDARDAQFGAAPLHWAMTAPTWEVAALLLKRGAAVNARNAAGQMPLHLAAIAGQQTYVESLLTNGALLFGRDTAGNTPRANAVAAGKTVIADLLAERERQWIAELQGDTLPANSAWGDFFARSASHGWDPVASKWKKGQGGKNVNGDPICLGGMTFKHGIGIQAVNDLTLYLGRQTQSLRAIVGLDNSVTDTGSVEFSIRANDRVLWSSGKMLPGQWQCMDVDVRQSQLVELHVSDAGDGNTHDRAVWAGFMVITEPYSAYVWQNWAIWFTEVPLLMPCFKSKSPDIRADGIRRLGRQWPMGQVLIDLLDDEAPCAVPSPDATPADAAMRMLLAAQEPLWWSNYYFPKAQIVLAPGSRWRAAYAWMDLNAVAAIPVVLDALDNPATRATAQAMLYRKLRETTNAKVDNTPAAWRAWWLLQQQHPANTTFVSGRWLPLYTGQAGTQEGELCINPKSGSVLVWMPPTTVTLGLSPAEAAQLSAASPTLTANMRASLDTMVAHAPPRTVTLHGYWIDLNPISVRQQRTTATIVLRGLPLRDARFYPVEDYDKPHGYISGDEAQENAKAFGGRLPTEAEWERFARYAATTHFSADTPAALRPQREGGMWEWCADWYADTPEKTATDPVGSTTGTRRVIRSARCGWLEGAPVELQCALRDAELPSMRRRDLGYRCVYPITVRKD